MTAYGISGNPESGAGRCPRHPDEVSYILCQRCGSPVCARCQRPAPVGVRCPDCDKAFRATAPRARTKAGAVLGRSTKPVITHTLVGICVAVYLLGWVFPVHYGAYVPILTVAQPWRILTSAFLHADGIHLLLNMMGLWMLGQALEPVLGRLRFALLYLLSALGGAAALVAWSLVTPQALLQPVVGASGAIFGLLGALFVLSRAANADVRSLLVLIGLNVVYGFVVPGIAWQAHLGGLLIGALATWVMVWAHRRRHPGLAYVALAVIAVLLGGFMYAGVTSLLM